MVIAVASGKGGTGKTTVVANLALSAPDSSSVVVMDCDVDEPNVHLYLDPESTGEWDVCLPTPVINARKCKACGKCADICQYHAIALLGDHVVVFRDLCHSCGGCALACPEGALHEEKRVIGKIGKGEGIHRVTVVTGTMNIGETAVTQVIKAVRTHVRRDGINIDAPPSTSCPLVASVRGVDACILVAEPTAFGLHDLDLAVSALKGLGIRGAVVVNKAGLAESDIQAYCVRSGLPVLGQMRFDREFGRLSSQGQVACLERDQWRQAFQELWRSIEEYVGR